MKKLNLKGTKLTSDKRGNNERKCGGIHKIKDKILRIVYSTK